jgi:hypothetical protein
MTSLAGLTYQAIGPDITVEAEFDLGKYGLPGKVTHTPGHSQSSASTILDGEEALVGSMIREESPGWIGLAMFY